MDTLVNGLAGLLLLSGLLFFMGTTIGILRFPSFYARMHAAGKADTLSTLLMLAAFVVLTLRHPELQDWVVCGKLGLIIGFIFVASPTAAHALIDAGYTADKEREDGE